MENNRKSANNPEVRHFPNNMGTVGKYFKQLRTRLIVGLSVGFMLPYCTLAAYFHFELNEMSGTKWLINSWLVLFLIAGCGFICFTVIKLTGRVQVVTEKKNELFFQLQQTSRLASAGRQVAEADDEINNPFAIKLVSVGKQVAEVAHEINNPLAIIISTSGVIRDMLNPEIDMSSSPDAINKELDTIDAAAFRVRKSTRFLVELGRKHATHSVSPG